MVEKSMECFRQNRDAKLICFSTSENGYGDRFKEDTA